MTKCPKYSDFTDRPIERIDVNTGEVKEYKNIYEAVRDPERVGRFGPKAKFNKNWIYMCCENIKEIHRGYYWQWLNIDIMEFDPSHKPRMLNVMIL